MYNVWKAFEELGKPVDTGNPITDILGTVNNVLSGYEQGQVIDDILDNSTQAPLFSEGGFFQHGNWNY